MKKILFLIATLALVSSFAFAEGSQEAAADKDQVFELKLGHVAEPDNPYALGAVKFAEIMEERTGGKS